MTHGTTVLVIEDDADVQHLLGSHLRRLGCSVRVAASGEEGVALAIADPPDVVVVDFLLPGIDGREVVRTLTQAAPLRRCHFVITSVLDPDDLVGLAGFPLLRKPFSRTDVARMLTGLDRGTEPLATIR